MPTEKSRISLRPADESGWSTSKDTAAGKASAPPRVHDRATLTPLVGLDPWRVIAYAVEAPSGNQVRPNVAARLGVTRSGRSPNTIVASTEVTIAPAIRTPRSRVSNRTSARRNAAIKPAPPTSPQRTPAAGSPSRPPMAHATVVTRSGRSNVVALRGGAGRTWAMVTARRPRVGRRASRLVRRCLGRCRRRRRQCLRRTPIGHRGARSGACRRTVPGRGSGG